MHYSIFVRYGNWKKCLFSPLRPTSHRWALRAPTSRLLWCMMCPSVPLVLKTQGYRRTYWSGLHNPSLSRKREETRIWLEAWRQMIIDCGNEEIDYTKNEKSNFVNVCWYLIHLLYRAQNLLSSQNRQYQAAGCPISDPWDTKRKRCSSMYPFVCMFMEGKRQRLTDTQSYGHEGTADLKPHKLRKTCGVRRRTERFQHTHC